MNACVKFALYVPCALLVTWLRGYVLARFYGWFVVPTFHTPPITPAAAYGLALLLFLATHVIPPNFYSEKDRDSTFTKLGGGVFISLFSLGLGWAIQRWWM